MEATMAVDELRRKNHFVPKVYLRRWAEDGARVQLYRLLVSAETVPVWKLSSISGIARHEHLYTRLIGDKQSDDFERWIDSEFESPAAAIIEAASAGRKLSKDDWWVLVRFLAAQDVRTPARLLEGLSRWRETVPRMVEEITLSVARGLEVGTAKNPRVATPKYADLLPIRVSAEPNADGDGGTLRVETDIGRGYWLFQIKHLLSNTAAVLHQHRWSMMVAPEGVEWITSDDPVLKLNFQSEREFNFGGGWASAGSEILLPISPRRLMYTKIGEKRRPSEIHATHEVAHVINRMIARHAHRSIFARHVMPWVEAFRPRRVDAAMVNEEALQWSAWTKEAAGSIRSGEHGGSVSTRLSVAPAPPPQES